MRQQLHSLCPCSSPIAQPPTACLNRRHVRSLLPVRAELSINQPSNPPPIDLRLSRRQLSLVGSTTLPLLLWANAHIARADDSDADDAPQPAADNASASDGGDASSITQRAFMDVSINGEPAGRIVVGLYGASAPKGSARFASLITGAPGTSYRRKEFIKIMPGYVQHGGVRAYGPEAAEELLAEWEVAVSAGRSVRTEAGSVGIVVRDPNKPPPKIKLVARKGRLEVDEEEIVPLPNGTEFVIATKDVPELSASTLVVGKVIEGMDVVEKIAGVKTVQENTSSPYFRVAKLIGDKRAVVAERGFNRPYSKIVITNCGVIS